MENRVLTPERMYFSIPTPILRKQKKGQRIDLF